MNTKKLSCPERKRAKRAARRALNQLQGALTVKQRKELRSSEKGLKVFLAEQAAKKAAG